MRQQWHTVSLFHSAWPLRLQKEEAVQEPRESRLMLFPLLAVTLATATILHGDHVNLLDHGG